jgi:hypothetical protein
MGEPDLRVLHVFGRLLRGGAELRTVELAESFGDGTVRSDFVVLSGLDGTLDARVRAAGGAVIKCPLDLRFPMSFWRLLRRGRYHVVHSHVHYFSGVILALARGAGVPGRIAHFRTAVADDRDGTPLRRAQLAVCRSLIQAHATDIIAVGEGAMERAWTRDWQGDSRCRVIYNGIPGARIRSARHRSPRPPRPFCGGSRRCDAADIDREPAGAAFTLGGPAWRRARGMRVGDSGAGDRSAGHAGTAAVLSADRAPAARRRR